MRFLIAFDFDRTIVEDNTDSVVQVIKDSGPIPSELNVIADEEGWTAFMQAVFKHLHSKGIQESEIKEKIQSMKFVQGMKECIQGLNDMGGDVIIISDSNTVFIDYLLVQNEVTDCFKAVYTNPAKFDSNGQLQLEPFHENKDCKLSGVNLCKGRVLKDYIDSNPEFEFVAYVGDGSNDFCPMLSLTSNDLAFPRSGQTSEYGITREIRRRKKQGLELKCKVREWCDGHDVLKIMRDEVQTRMK